jgi:hypothetical protein
MDETERENMRELISLCKWLICVFSATIVYFLDKVPNYILPIKLVILVAITSLVFISRTLFLAREALRTHNNSISDRIELTFNKYIFYFSNLLILFAVVIVFIYIFDKIGLRNETFRTIIMSIIGYISSKFSFINKYLTLPK